MIEKQTKLQKQDKPKYNMQQQPNQFIQSQSAKKEQNNKKLNGIAQRFHSFKKHFLKFVLSNKNLYYWKGGWLSWHHMGPRLNRLLKEKIRSKQDLDAILSLKEKQNNDQESIQQILFICKIFDDFKQFFPNSISLFCCGQTTYTQELFEYFEILFRNFKGCIKFEKQIKPCQDIKKQVKILLDRIKRREKILYDQNKVSKKKLKLILEQERKINADLSSLKNNNLKKYPIYQLKSLKQSSCSEAFRHDHMIRFKQIFEEYIHQYAPIEGYQKMPKNSKYKSQNITAKRLKDLKKQTMEIQRRQIQIQEQNSQSRQLSGQLPIQSNIRSGVQAIRDVVFQQTINRNRHSQQMVSQNNYYHKNITSELNLLVEENELIGKKSSSGVKMLNQRQIQKKIKASQPKDEDSLVIQFNQQFQIRDKQNMDKGKNQDKIASLNNKPFILPSNFNQNLQEDWDNLCFFGKDSNYQYGSFLPFQQKKQSFQMQQEQQINDTY